MAKQKLVYLFPEEIAELKALAAENMTSVKEVMDQILQHYLDHLEAAGHLPNEHGERRTVN